MNASAANRPAYTEAVVYQTAPSARRPLASEHRAFEPLEQPDENVPTIFVDVDKTFQTIEGFGGAFTDASADNFAKLSPEAQESFLKACFDPTEGSGYTLCRTTIHSCDYAAGMYTYDDVAGDTELEHFSIEPDRRARIPYIKRALAAAQGNLRLYASPWSPPAWMKTNGDMRYGGQLRPEYRRTWADYFVKYVRAYEAEGIPIWGLTVQNEALATQVWESCVFTAAEERDFVRDYLGPTLHANGLADLKLMFWDHNRGLMYQRAEVMYDDPEAAQYIWGQAFHWYTGDHHDNVRMVHDAWPDKQLLYTEAGMGGSWDTAVRLATEHHPRPQQLGDRLDLLEHAARRDPRAAPRRGPGRHPASCRWTRRRVRSPTTRLSTPSPTSPASSDPAPAASPAPPAATISSPPPL